MKLLAELSLSAKVLVGGTGTGKTHLAIARSCIRGSVRGRHFKVVNRLEADQHARQPVKIVV